jgi:hypothetical protein
MAQHEGLKKNAVVLPQRDSTVALGHVPKKQYWEVSKLTIWIWNSHKMNVVETDKARRFLKK